MSPLPIKPFHLRSAVVFLPWESCTQKALLHTALGEGKRICYHHGGGQVWGTSPITSPSKRQEQPPQPCSWAGHEAPTRTESWPWASAFPQKNGSQQHSFLSEPLSPVKDITGGPVKRTFSACSAARGISPSHQWPRHASATDRAGRLQLLVLCWQRLPSQGRYEQWLLWVTAHHLDISQHTTGSAPVPCRWVFVSPNHVSTVCGFAGQAGHNAYLWALWLCRSL